MKKVNINKKVLTIVIAVLVAAISFSGIGVGIHYTVKTNEQKAIYESSMAKVENINSKKVTSLADKFFGSNKKYHQKKADKALELKEQYQKHAIIFYCCGGAILCGDIAFIILVKIKSNKKRTQESEE